MPAFDFCSLFKHGGFLFALNLPSLSGESCWRVFHDEQTLWIACARLARKGLLVWRAFDNSGIALDQARLIRLGKRSLALLAKRPRYVWIDHHVGYERRTGPVAGTACRRGGPSGCHRRMRTFPERRLAQEGFDPAEPATRSKRSVSNLPNPWDDFARCNPTGWKASWRGKKNWDRPERTTASAREFWHLAFGGEQSPD